MPPPYEVIPHPTVLGYMRGIPDLFIPNNLGLNPSGLVGLEVQTRFAMTGVSIASKQYIEQREGGYWIANKRVSLDSIVYNFLNGTSPEEIASHFPLVTLEEVYGAIRPSDTLCERLLLGQPRSDRSLSPRRRKAI